MKKPFLTIMLAVFGCWMYAAPVTIKSAKQVAINFYKHSAVKTFDYTISNEYTNQYEGITTYYVFSFKSGGFVMVAADDASIPILGYSTDEPFDKNKIPANTKSLFDSYSKQIKVIVDSKIDNSVTTTEWKNVQDENFTSSKITLVSIAPLCSTIWSQGCGYNAMCPSDNATSCSSGVTPNPCGHDYTGCMATAMAQMMKYWKYPTTYDWSNMLNRYVVNSYTYTQQQAVANLMHDCGTSISMQ